VTGMTHDERCFPAVYAIGAVILLAGLALVFAFNPTQSHLFPPCPLYAATGLYCPGCGSTRAVHQLLHGHVAAAFGYNPLMVVSLPFLAYAAARGLFRALPPRRPLPAWAVWVTFAVVVGFGIVRNLPWAAVRWMAPHDARAATNVPNQTARSTVAFPPRAVSRRRLSPTPPRPV
jgi:hypothetical protein